ncbi:MAG TPA: DNA replication/repair protein RecF [Candidatus Saccharimonadales bacterium]|nr:DNA replication/repair protein RecF [Candidatus Saccharimonadales bacterium]
MKLDWLHLKQFRNYSDQSFKFDGNLTIITGKNGVGKTNILESVYLLLNGSSWRDHDRDLISFERDWWRIDGRIDDHERSVSYKTEPVGLKQISTDGSPWRRFSSPRKLPAVLFEPDQLNMVHGSPGSRRRFIDEMIVSLDPSYNPLTNRYERVLRQRNNLLKQHRFSSKLEDLMFAWDVSLAQYGAEIMTKRRDLAEALNQGLSQLYSELSGQVDDLLVDYQPSLKIDSQTESRLAKLLKTNLKQDQSRGYTSVGPHRDDFSFVLNGQPAATSASRGEVRSLVYGLKRRQLSLIEEVSGIKPIFLMDDLFSELDESRQKNISTRFGNQTIITTTAAHPEIKAKRIRL